MAVQNTARAARDAQGFEPSFSTKLNDFLRKHRRAFLALLILLVAGLAAASGWTIYKSAADARVAKALESADAAFEAWNVEADAARKADLLATLEAELEALSKHGPTSYASLSALVLKARIAETAEDWSKAEALYAEAAHAAPARSHLGASSLRRAAFAAERSGANDRAQALWTEFVEAYEGKAAGIERARLALLRLAEASKDYAAAKAQHDALVSGYPDSDWTKLARNRILYLESQGLLK